MASETPIASSTDGRRQAQRREPGQQLPDERRAHQRAGSSRCRGRGRARRRARPAPAPPRGSAPARAGPGSPSVLSTAISVRRSRTAMLIVLAVTSRIVNVTARPMPLSSSERLPTSAMKPATNAPSVSVFVCASRFSNSASIALLTSADLRRVVDLHDVGARLHVRVPAGGLVEVLVVEERLAHVRAGVARPGRRRRSRARRTRTACRRGTAGWCSPSGTCRRSSSRTSPRGRGR